MKQHETAVVSPKAEIAEDVSVGAYAVIGDGARLAEGVVVEPLAAVVGDVVVGPGTYIGHGVCVGYEPQDLSYDGAPSGVTVGARCRLREYATVHRASGEGKRTVIGDDCFIMAYAHVAHNCRLGEGVCVANATQIAGYSEIGDNAFISGSVVVHQFSRIGRLAMVGGATRVNQDVPPFIMAVGGDIGVVGLNLVGLRRAEFDRTTLRALRDAFEVLYRRGLPLPKALALFDNELPDLPEIAELKAFIESSKRGIVRRLYRGNAG